MVEEKPYGFSIDKIGTRIPDPVLKNRLNPAAGGRGGGAWKPDPGSS